MLRSITTHFEAIGIASVSKVRQILALKTVQVFVNARSARMAGEVELFRTVVVGDTVDINRRRATGHASVRVPSVVAIAPCATSDVDVSRTGIALFVGESVGIATLVLIVEILVRVAVDDHVVATASQLNAGIATAVNIKVLKYVVLSIFYPDAFVSGVTDGDVLEVQIAASHLNAILFVGLLTEVDNGLAVTISLNGDEFVGSAFAVDGERALQVVLSAQQIEVVARL